MVRHTETIRLLVADFYLTKNCVVWSQDIRIIVFFLNPSKFVT